MNDDGTPLPNSIAKTTLEELIRLNGSSYREIERILSYFAIIHNMANNGGYIPQYQYLMAFVCFIKCVEPDLLSNIVNGAIGPDDLLDKTKLRTHENEPDATHLSDLARYIRYDLSSDAERKVMVDSNMIRAERMSLDPHDVMIDISNWLSEINIGN